ncbi:class II aldolase/adducin family protein [Streptomyces sp. bgisy027]|uniref:class II aldolase/adducin family protein n=1 Tax=unclassified Streptomyces TaxID=2593676 RepID=UPI003D7532B2
MAAALGDGEAVVLRGHGLTTTGAGVPEAVLRAIPVDTIARLSLDVVKAGGTLTHLPDEGMRELPGLGGSFNHDMAWRHELARLVRHMQGTAPGSRFLAS